MALGIKRVRNGKSERVHAAQYRERNKLSVTLDLKQPQGIALFKRLCAKVDVVCENFSVGAMARLGLGYEDIRQVNPSIVYASITAFGQEGPYAKQRGYDVRVGSFPFGVLGRAKMAGETEGFVEIVSDRKYDEVLGVHMIGPRSTELVAEAVLALRLECTVEELIKTIHAHPTFSEAVGEAAHATHGAAIHA